MRCRNVCRQKGGWSDWVNNCPRKRQQLVGKYWSWVFIEVRKMGGSVSQVFRSGSALLSNRDGHKVSETTVDKVNTIFDALRANPKISIQRLEPLLLQIPKVSFAQFMYNLLRLKHVSYYQSVIVELKWGLWKKCWSNFYDFWHQRNINLQIIIINLRKADK